MVGIVGDLGTRSNRALDAIEVSSGAATEKLVGRGIAYRASDGSVYFSIDKYRANGGQYGQLVKLNFEEMRTAEMGGRLGTREMSDLILRAMAEDR